MALVSKTFGAYTITSVPIGAIQEQDPFTARFLDAQQYETDIAVNLEYWDTRVIEALTPRLLPILIRRQGGYQYLGSGLTLRLLQQCFGPHDEVPALVLDARRISNKTKLDILSGDLLLLPPFFRTRRFLPRRNLRLWEAVIAAGGTPIRGAGVHAFSQATGYSHNALKPPKSNKSSGTNPVDIAQTLESTLTEEDA